MTRIQFFAIIIAAAIFVSIGAPTTAVPPDNAPVKVAAQPKQPEPNPLKLPSRKEAMQMKLKSSQTILEGIALNDFEKIQAAADQIVLVSNLTDFRNIYKGRDYAFHVETMRRPAETISKKAKDKNIDGVMVSYNDLTLSCLKCHQAMRDKVFVSTKVPE